MKTILSKRDKISDVWHIMADCCQSYFRDVFTSKLLMSFIEHMLQKYGIAKRNRTNCTAGDYIRYQSLPLECHWIEVGHFQRS